MGTVVFGQVGEERPGAIQSESDGIPIIIGGRDVQVVIRGQRQTHERPPQPVLLRKRYIEEVTKRAGHMSAEELEVAIEKVRQENEQIETRHAEEQDAIIKAAIQKMRSQKQD